MPEREERIWTIYQRPAHFGVFDLGIKPGGPNLCDPAKRLEQEPQQIEVVPLSRALTAERQRDEIAKERQTRTRELVELFYPHLTKGGLSEVLAYAAVVCEQGERRTEDALAQLSELIAGWDNDIGPRRYDELIAKARDITEGQGEPL